MNKGWKKVKLGDIVLLNYGKALISSNRIHGSIPVYSSGGITGYHNNPLVNSDGIIVGRKGTVGTVYYSPSPFFCIDTAYYILPSENYNIKYIYYRLRSLGLDKLNEDSAVPGLNRDTAYSQTFKLPPLNEQNIIAKILSCLDDKIELNENINHHLEQVAQAIFKSWFVDFEPFTNNAFINTEIGEIPEGWNILSIDEVCDIKGGKRLPKGKNLIPTPNNHPYIKVRDMNNVIFIQMNDTIEYVCDEIQNTISRYIVSTNDVLISIVGTIGMVCKVHSSLNNANLTENCVKLTNFQGVSSDFLYFFLSSLGGQEAIKQGTVGAVQAKLPIKNIQTIRFPCPPSKIITEFDRIIKYIMQKIANNCSENRRLATLRDTLLPRLMSGELRISDIESAK